MKLLMKLLVALSFLAVVVINGLANMLPINGVTTGGVSDSYPNLFTPAGLTFSIWGLIYLLLAGFVLFSLGVFGKKRSAAADKVAWPFIISSLANIAWLFSWHYGLIWLSVVFMLCLLVSLIVIATRLRSLRLSPAERWLVRLPFSVYFGWITVATIANITVFLVSIGWGGFGLSEAFWTVLVLVVGALIGLWRSYVDRDVAYLLVFVWAYTGILVRHLSPSGFAGEYGGVIVTLIVCLGVFVLMVGYLAYRSWVRRTAHSEKRRPKKKK
ncbi:tryptophan-rich sensory protein [Candidatus Woesearchaeota archaeon]|nr:tryptophan-rich sensory protein [Candidatus Woesearchaeota archaeon]